MGETNKIVVLSPTDTLVFSGEVSAGRATSSLNVSNPTPRQVFLKVKTTKPLRYCVSPAFGLMNGNANMELSIRMKEKHLSPEDITRDKFLIQTIYKDDVLEAGEDPIKAFSLGTKRNIVEHRMFVTNNAGNLVPDEVKHVDSSSFKSAGASDENEQKNAQLNRTLSNDSQSRHQVASGFFSKIFGSSGFRNREDVNLKCLLFSILTALLGFFLGYYFHEQIDLSVHSMLGDYKHCKN